MAERPNYNPTPKQVFLADALGVKAHKTLLDSPYLHQVIDVAILHYSRLMCDHPRTTDGNTAAQNHFKMQGVHEFIHILKNLSETPEIPKTTLNTEKLDYK